MIISTWIEILHELIFHFLIDLIIIFEWIVIFVFHQKTFWWKKMLWNEIWMKFSFFQKIFVIKNNFWKNFDQKNLVKWIFLVKFGEIWPKNLGRFGENNTFLAKSINRFGDLVTPKIWPNAKKICPKSTTSCKID